MPVVTGSLVGQFGAITHVSNGDPANATVFKTPSVGLENRTDALRTFVDAQEVLRNAQTGASASAVGGLQGDFNANHHHTGTDGSFLMDFQQVYNNDSDQADLALASAGSFTVKDNVGDVLLAIDNDTKAVAIPTWTDNTVHDNALDYGTGTNQINLDAIPDGSVTGKVSLVKQAAYDAHVVADASSVHSLQLQAKPLSMNPVSALGTSIDVTSTVGSETAGGNSTTQGLVTDSTHNLVIIKVAGSFDDLTDNYGNKVYGRLTYAGSVFTLSFFSNIAGTETPYSFATSQSIAWWVQKVYTLSNITTYDSAFQISSDEVAGTRRQRQPNLAINGNFDFAGAGSTSIADSTVLKRWTAHWAGFTTSTFTHAITSSVTDLPDPTAAGFKSVNAYKLTSTGIEPAIASSAVAKLRHIMKGQDLQSLGFGHATLSFWVKAAQAGTYSVCLKNRLEDRSYVTQFVVNQAGVVERKAVVLDMSGLASGTWDFNGDASTPGMFIDFVAAAGTGQRALVADLDSWKSPGAGLIYASPNQTNMTTLASGTFTISQVAIRRGTDPGALFERAGSLYDVESLIV